MSKSFSGGEPLLVTKKEVQPPECRGPAFKECFDFEATVLPAHAYDTTYEKEERSSILFVNSLIINDAQFVDQEGTLLAYNRSYRHYPLGAGGFATIFGFASGHPPSTVCRGKYPSDYIQQIYPAITN